MKNVEDQIAELRGHIEQLETVGRLESKLVEMKEAGDTDSEEYRQLKHDLREARRAQRSGRAAAVSPDTVAASSQLEEG